MVKWTPMGILKTSFIGRLRKLIYCGLSLLYNYKIKKEAMHTKSFRCHLYNKSKWLK
jgi:hypothetical protein